MHMCDKAEAHEVGELDFSADRVLLCHVRGMGYIIVYTNLSGHVGLKMFTIL